MRTPANTSSDAVWRPPEGQKRRPSGQILQRFWVHMGTETSGRCDVTRCVGCGRTAAPPRCASTLWRPAPASPARSRGPGRAVQGGSARKGQLETRFIRKTLWFGVFGCPFLTEQPCTLCSRTSSPLWSLRAALPSAASRSPSATSTRRRPRRPTRLARRRHRRRGKGVLWGAGRRATR